MVKNSPSLNRTFAALADPTRRAILARLAEGESSVTTLAEPFPISLPAVSKHLRVLEQAGLVIREKAGRVHRCHLATGRLQEAASWLGQYRAFWESQFEALARHLRQSRRTEGRPRQARGARRRHFTSGVGFLPPGRRPSGSGRVR